MVDEMDGMGVMVLKDVMDLVEVIDWRGGMDVMNRMNR